MFTLLRKLRFLFLFFVLLLFCLTKAVEAQVDLWRLTDFVLVILIVTSLVVIGEQEHRLLFWLTVLGILQVASQMIINVWGSQLPIEAFKSFLAMIFFVLMTVACLRLTLKDESINITTLFGSLSSYVFIGLAFAYLYLMIYVLDNQSLSGLRPHEEVRAIYYSFSTLTTVGFGDILATKPVMQTLTWMEAFCGQAYMAIFISQLVGRFVAEKMTEKS
ncbi:Ion channel [Legionella rubrilucens]|uniref:Ion channel n=1 Tax=Legionella rubrilucens TaxID=458 RepID=A0A0W0Y0K2_9GAMM|nr:ion channel [Legionella rubrilucens]KTD50561.1 Ion channel [Legionella rubrilucens]